MSRTKGSRTELRDEYKDFDYNDKLSFNAEWLDESSLKYKQLILSYYPNDDSLEIYDRDLNRVFYKRTKTDVAEEDLFVGSTIVTLGRKIKITDYANIRTKDIVQNIHDTTFSMVKPCLVRRFGEVLVEMTNRGYRVVNMRMCTFTRKEALDLYAPFKGVSYMAFILEQMVSGPLIALEIMSKNAVERWFNELGPVDPLEARRVAPNSMRALFGGDSRVLNGFHAARSRQQADSEVKHMFPKDRSTPTPETVLKMYNTTCCIIKPHAIKTGLLGHIWNAIKEGKFEINACKMIYLTATTAGEYLDIYKGLVNDFHSILESFIDGPCVVLEIASSKPEINVQQEFRKFCGPNDPEVAREIRPYTLRSRFGVNRYQNAVHCTDLQDDTTFELHYLFKVLGTQ